MEQPRSCSSVTCARAPAHIARSPTGGRDRPTRQRPDESPALFAPSASTTLSSLLSIETICRMAAHRHSPKPFVRLDRGILECRIEVLIPDFQGSESALRTVLDARPDVLNHNTETVPRLYRMARSGGRYPRTLELLDRARRHTPDIPTKTGLMVGLGEEHNELIATFRDLREVGCKILTIGQYLAAERGSCPGGALLPSRRVPRTPGRRARGGLRSRRIRAARAQLVPRARDHRHLPTGRRRIGSAQTTGQVLLDDLHFEDMRVPGRQVEIESP